MCLCAHSARLGNLSRSAGRRERRPARFPRAAFCVSALVRAQRASWRPASQGRQSAPSSHEQSPPSRGDLPHLLVSSACQRRQPEERILSGARLWLPAPHCSAAGGGTSEAPRGDQQGRQRPPAMAPQAIAARQRTPATRLPCCQGGGCPTSRRGGPPCAIPRASAGGGKRPMTERRDHAPLEKNTSSERHSALRRRTAATDDILISSAYSGCTTEAMTSPTQTHRCWEEPALNHLPHFTRPPHSARGRNRGLPASRDALLLHPNSRQLCQRKVANAENGGKRGFRVLKRLRRRSVGAVAEICSRTARIARSTRQLRQSSPSLLSSRALLRGNRCRSQRPSILEGASEAPLGAERMPSARPQWA